MPTEITVLLPDGSARAVPAGRRSPISPARSAPLAQAAVAADATESSSTCPARSAKVTRSASSPQIPRKAGSCSGTRPPTSWHRRCSALARRVLRHRAGDRRRLLLRLRAAPRGPLLRRGPRPHRARDAGDHGRGPALRPRRARSIERARALRRTSPTRGDHRAGVGFEAGAELDEELAATGRGVRAPCQTYRNAELCRPLPRSSRAVHRPARHFQADAGGRRLLARRRAPPQLQRIYGTAWESAKALRPSPSPRRSRTARPPPTRRRARPVLLSRRDRLRPRRVPPKRRPDPEVMEDYSRPPRGSRLRLRQLAPHHQRGAFEISGHLDWFAEGMFPPMELDAASSTT